MLEQTHEFANLQEIKLALSYIAIWTARVEGCRTDCYLEVSTPTAKLQNLILCQIFKFGDDVLGLFIKEHCRLSLEVLEQTHEFANLQEIKLALS